MTKIYLPFLISLGFCIQIIAQETDQEPISYGASYVADVGRNLSGGIQQDNLYLGFIELSADADLHKLGLWKGASVQASFINTHGRLASEEVIGDDQVASNIDNGQASVLMNALFLQNWEKTSVFIGKHDMNADFMSCDHGSLFLNSSAGVLPTVSGNMPVSIFPLTVVGAGAFYSPNAHFTFKGAVYDGQITGEDPYSADFMPSGESFLGVGEVEYLSDSLGLSIKGGAVLHSEKRSALEDSSESDFNKSLYLMIDKYLFPVFGGNLVVFGHTGFAPHKINEVGNYYSLGCNLEDINGKHSAGLLLGRMQMSDAWQNMNAESPVHEIFIEATMAFSLGQYVTLQPDIQYIIHPGISNELDNALVAFLRIGVEF